MSNKKSFFEKSLFPEEDKKEVKENLCEKCKLYRNCISPRMESTGQGKKKVLIIAEAPGEQEDIYNTQLIGKAGQLLRNILDDIDVDLDRDCWKTNAIICRPLKNKTPSLIQINYCRNNLLSTIEKYKPEKIITLGKIALQSLIGKKVSITSINKWIGWRIPDQDYKCWIYPLNHPQYLNYNANDIVLKRNFKKYLKQAFDHNEEFPVFDIENIVKVEKNENEIIKFLQTIVEGDVITFDYETTGIKPHKEGHKIICMSIAVKEKVVSFPVIPEIKTELKRILNNNNIKKTAHNLKFEHVWSKIILEIDVQGWFWDSMIASHVLDNRSGITGLKFQTYINFGVIDYDKNVCKYLKTKGKSGNAFNKIKECDLDELLLYCGLDSYFTKKLTEKQMEIFSKLKKRKEAFVLFFEGQKEFANIQFNGVCFDNEKYKRNNRILEKKTEILNNKIQNNEEVKQLNKEEIFNFNSPKQLTYLLYNTLNWKTNKLTATGLKSTDKETLENFNNPFTNNILKHRYLMKIKDTYLSQFEREMIKKDGQYLIYPNFNLNTVRTYRSSSSNPNFQNIPNRDDYAKRMVRNCLIPRKNNKLLEVDYSGIEVRISVCYHEDPVMLEYVHNLESDMHRDVAIDLFKLEKNECTKELRYLAKNGFVFPQFYGSYWELCANNIWNSLTESQLILLKSKGFKNYSFFEKWVRNVEDIFWNERFKEYKKWKIRTYQKYEKTGFVKMKTGFKCFAPMKKNDVLNYPIQGTAFHILLWSLIQLNRELREKQMNSYIIGQIHDSIVLDIVPDEEKIIKKMIRRIMCNDVRNYYKWIIVPLDIEAEITEINGSWYTKKVCEI